MTDNEKMKAKERILNTAIFLFAQRGYAGIGIREIAEKANVNISMISYYFQGKIGILSAIFNQFHVQYLECIQNAIDDTLPPEVCVRSIISNIFKFVRNNTDLAMVAFNIMPLDIPEITNLKLKRIDMLIQAIGGLMTRFGLDPDDRITISIIGPGLLSMILAHFRLRPIQKKYFDLKFDDVFYNRYQEIITTLFLDGITGVVKLNKLAGDSHEKSR